MRNELSIRHIQARTEWRCIARNLGRRGVIPDDAAFVIAKEDRSLSRHRGETLSAARAAKARPINVDICNTC